LDGAAGSNRVPGHRQRIHLVGDVGPLIRSQESSIIVGAWRSKVQATTRTANVEELTKSSMEPTTDEQVRLVANTFKNLTTMLVRLHPLICVCFGVAGGHTSGCCIRNMFEYCRRHTTFRHIGAALVGHAPGFLPIVLFVSMYILWGIVRTRPMARWETCVWTTTCTTMARR